MRRAHRVSVVLVLLTIYVAVACILQVEAGGQDERLTPKEEALVELGRRLFFDPLVSRSGARSCSSCHDPEHGFSDRTRVSEDDFGRTRRHSQTLLDGALNPSAHWDGEFGSVEELVLARVGALQGRKGRRGQSATLLQVGGGASDESTAGAEDVIDEGEGAGGGGGGGTSYGAGEAGDTAEDAKDGADGTPEETENPRGDDLQGPKGGSSSNSAASGHGECPADGASGDDDSSAARSAPAGKGAEAEGAGGKKASKQKATEKKAAGKPQGKANQGQAKPGKGQPGKGKKPNADAAKSPSPKELRRRADLLRRNLMKLPLAAERIERGGLYGEGFAAAFGNAKVSTARIARAVAAYCRSIRSTTSPYDRYVAGDRSALSASAVRGLALFRGRAGCASCHSMRGGHAPFTDYAFHNTGVTWHGLVKKTRVRLAQEDAALFRRKKDALETPPSVDEGRARVSTRHRDLRSFKTPTLRDVARRGPYMHDGRLATLKDVVRYYAEGTSKDPAKDATLHGFATTEADVADLVAFLEALTGEDRAGLPARPWRSRAASTRLKLVDADGRALVGVPVRLTPVGDNAARDVQGLGALPTQTTDARGWIAFPRTSRTHVRITLPGGMGLRDGALVPDTCRKARVRVPVRGKTAIVVRYPAGVPVPDVLVAVHQGTIVLPGHEAPRTRLERTHVITSGDVRIVRYEGWLRTDVPSDVLLRVPGVRKKTVKAVLSGKDALQIDVAKLR